MCLSRYSDKRIGGEEYVLKQNQKVIRVNEGGVRDENNSMDIYILVAFFFARLEILFLTFRRSRKIRSRLFAEWSFLSFLSRFFKTISSFRTNPWPENAESFARISRGRKKLIWVKKIKNKQKKSRNRALMTISKTAQFRA